MPSEDRAMSLEQAIATRGVNELLHFTTNFGALGILASRRLKSRRRLSETEELDKIAFFNTANRDRDKEWVDYVSLTISNPNQQFFDVCSRRWHRDKDIWWAVFSFSPCICLHPGVFFATTNNMYSGVKRGTGEDGFQSIFAPKVHQYLEKYVSRSAQSPASAPTCNQAEVLYPGEVSTDFLRRVYVRSDEHANELAGQISAVGHAAVEVLIRPDWFGSAE